MTYPYRCTRRCCRIRKALPKHAHQYIREPKCKACGGNLSFDATKRARTKKDTCKCDGYCHPHYKGTEPWCIDAKIGPTEKDFEERYYGVTYR